uniref:RxLR effector candidate protein n=1 Tax=Peronospora matthiolae TaxID=2874970 RepID=A0AAV1UQW1_9STRA
MRLYPLALVFSTVTLTRNTDSSRVRGLSVAERPSGRLHGTMTAEERAQPLALGADEGVIKTAAAALVASLHSHDADAPEPLTNLVKTHLTSIDMEAIELHLKRLCGGHEATPPVTSAGVLEYQRGYHQMISGSEHTRDEVITVVRKSVEAHQLQIANDMEATRKKWISVERDPDYVFKELSIAGNGDVNCFASPNLGVLKEYIRQYNHLMHTEIRLVDTFINGFGGEDKLAVVLSTVKLSPIYRFQAQDMQERLFEKLIWRKLNIDGFADSLGMSADTKRVLAYQYLEAVTAYALAYDKAHKKQTDICVYLIGKLGDADFALRIGYAKFVSTSFANKLEKKLFRRWEILGAPRIDPSPIEADEKVMDSMKERYVTFHDKNVALSRPAVLHSFFPHPSRANRR